MNILLLLTLLTLLILAAVGMGSASDLPEYPHGIF